VRRALLVVLLLLLAGCAGGETAAPAPVSTPAPAPACDPGPPGTRHVQVGKRWFLLHVPADLHEPSPVVFTFHGLTSNAQQQLALTGFEQVSEEGRFLLVAPEAYQGRWDLTGARDRNYLRRVAAAVPCMDPTRVYASGMSMGSAMTFALACAPDRKFAAFGGVALTFYEPQCEQAPPAPIIYFHGTADTVVPFEGGRPTGEQVRLPAVADAMREWAGHNACTDESVQKAGSDVTLREWTQCDAGADVDYYRVRAGGHTWPGGPEFVADLIEPALGRTTQSVDASRLMWEFFQRYSLPG